MSYVVQKRMDDKQGKDNCDNKTVRCPIRGGSTRLMHYRWFREGQEVICWLLLFGSVGPVHFLFHCLFVPLLDWVRVGQEVFGFNLSSH